MLDVLFIFVCQYFNWKRRGFFMALLVTVIWHFISYRIYHPHGKRKNFCKGRVEKVRANIAYSLLPWRTSQNLQVRRVKRKDLSFDVRVTLRKLEWQRLGTSHRRLVSPGIQAEGNLWLCLSWSPNISVQLEAIRTSKSFDLTNLPDIFLINCHLCIFALSPPSHKGFCG